MSARIDRKGRDIREGKREDRLRRDVYRLERDRLMAALEDGASAADLTVPTGPWPTSEYEARHIG